jgi:hypothetical protein
MCDRLERGGAMSTNKAYARKNSAPKKMAVYFRVTADIIFRMRNYSLIRWRDLIVSILAFTGIFFRHILTCIRKPAIDESDDSKSNLSLDTSQLAL